MDVLNTKIIKQTIHTIVSPLTYLFNTCIREGNFPDVFKVTKVIPILELEISHVF